MEEFFGMMNRIYCLIFPYPLTETIRMFYRIFGTLIMLIMLSQICLDYYELGSIKGQNRIFRILILLKQFFMHTLTGNIVLIALHLGIFMISSPFYSLLICALTFPAYHIIVNNQTDISVIFNS